MKRYTFIVDCGTPKDCRLMRSKMAEDGFENIKPITSFSGDHTATKMFKTFKEADEAAKSLLMGNMKHVYHVGIMKKAVR